MVRMGKGKEKEKEKEKKKEKNISDDVFKGALRTAYDSFSNEIVETEKRDKTTKKRVLREGITKIEKDSRKEVDTSRIIVNKLVEMKKKAGLSPTLGTSGEVKSPKLFGKEEFKNLLSRELLYIGNEELAAKGTYAISSKNFIDYFRNTRDNWKVDDTEILDTIIELEETEVIPKTVEITDDEFLIRFKPIELSGDIQDILRMATGRKALSIEDIHDFMGWDRKRAQTTMNLMVEKNLAIHDEETDDYYFPSISVIE